MACLSPTIAAKRAQRDRSVGNLAGVWTIFITRARSDGTRPDYSASSNGIPTSCARRGRACEPVVDRFAEARVRDRHHRDGGGACGIERAQVGEQIGGGFDQIAARREVEHQQRRARHPRAATGPKASSASPASYILRMEPQPRPRRVVGGELPGAIGAVVRAGRMRRLAEREPRARSAARGSPPGRSSTARSRQATMVDSSPIGVAPAVDDQLDTAAQVGEHVLRAWSATHVRSGSPTAPPPGGRTPPGCRARPDGWARARRSCRGPRWQAPPPGNPAALGSTSVSGPGQNAAASRSASASKRASARAAAASATCAMSGLNAGRPLAS